MGCGASSTSAETASTTPEVKESAPKAVSDELPPDTETASIPQQEVVDDDLAECKGPDETLMQIPPLRVTPMTRGPRKKGIHVRASAKCKCQVLFICKDAAKTSLTTTGGGAVTANVEIKPFYGPDDLKQDWSETGAGAPGVYYLVPTNDISCCGSIAPSKYMFRWNIAGVRCRSAASLNCITESLAKNTDESDLNEKVLAFLKSLPEMHNDIDEEFDERVIADLKGLGQSKSARYLSNNLAAFKSLLMSLEDSVLYNMFDFDLGIDHLIGHYHGLQHVMSNREKAELAVVREASGKKNIAASLERMKKSLHTSVKELVKQKLEVVGLDAKAVIPSLEEDLTEVCGTLDACAVGLGDIIKGQGCSKMMSPELDGQLLARENDPFDVRQRVQNHYRTHHQSASPMMPILCAQNLYHVDIYLVLPKGTPNTFKRAYLTLWEEGNLMHINRVSMKEYWTGPVRDSDSTNSDSEAGDSDDEVAGEELADDVESLEESDEEEENGDAEGRVPESPSNRRAVWKGFYCTVPLQPDVVYCYRVVVDGLAYLSATVKRKSRSNFCKKLKISPKISAWSVNTVREAGLI
eukprot:TRINITY_DN18174_c0_g1_i1.p1 TRINITY_DN18174_c0_g1~~TRINITY_DN18174_c0_g1_i1.p1  ORF type:complete len:580 (+),score=187.28 TRINITY_DN18174_c0_g1_i1:197-1936(+)